MPICLHLSELHDHFQMGQNHLRNMKPDIAPSQVNLKSKITCAENSQWCYGMLLALRACPLLPSGGSLLCLGSNLKHVTSMWLLAGYRHVVAGNLGPHVDIHVRLHGRGFSVSAGKVCEGPSLIEGRPHLPGRNQKKQRRQSQVFLSFSHWDAVHLAGHCGPPQAEGQSRKIM